MLTRLVSGLWGGKRAGSFARTPTQITITYGVFDFTPKFVVISSTSLITAGTFSLLAGIFSLIRGYTVTVTTGYFSFIRQAFTVIGAGVDVVIASVGKIRRHLRR